MLPLFIFLIKGKAFIFYVFFDIAVMADILNKINSINLQIVVGFIALPIGTRTIFRYRISIYSDRYNIFQVLNN